MVPRRMTCLVQPLDVGINMVIKAKLRDIYRKWIQDDLSRTKVRKCLLLEWVKNVWDAIEPNVIQKAFKKAVFKDKVLELNYNGNEVEVTFSYEVEEEDASNDSSLIDSGKTSEEEQESNESDDYSIGKESEDNSSD